MSFGSDYLRRELRANKLQEKQLPGGVVELTHKATGLSAFSKYRSLAEITLGVKLLEREFQEQVCCDEQETGMRWKKHETGAAQRTEYELQHRRWHGRIEAEGWYTLILHCGQKGSDPGGEFRAHQCESPEEAKAVAALVIKLRGKC